MRRSRSSQKDEDYNDAARSLPAKKRKNSSVLKFPRAKSEPEPEQKFEFFQLLLPELREKILLFSCFDFHRIPPLMLTCKRMSSMRYGLTLSTYNKLVWLRIEAEIAYRDGRGQLPYMDKQYEHNKCETVVWNIAATSGACEVMQWLAERTSFRASGSTIMTAIIAARIDTTHKLLETPAFFSSDAEHSAIIKDTNFRACCCDHACGIFRSDPAAAMAMLQFLRIMYGDPRLTQLGCDLLFCARATRALELAKPSKYAVFRAAALNDGELLVQFAEMKLSPLTHSVYNNKVHPYYNRKLLDQVETSLSTAIHRAVHIGNIALVEFLLTHYPDLVRELSLFDVYYLISEMLRRGHFKMFALWVAKLNPYDMDKWEEVIRRVIRGNTGKQIANLLVPLLSTHACFWPAVINAMISSHTRNSSVELNSDDLPRETSPLAVPFDDIRDFLAEHKPSLCFKYILTAVRTGNLDIVKLVHSYRPKKYARPNLSDRALTMAKKQNNKDIETYLIENRLCASSNWCKK